MGDHLALLVDRLLTESTLEATIDNGKRAQNPPDPVYSVVSIEEFSQRRKDEKLVECRICQEEDEASNMEIPCSCCGSLKYAHRKCVQRWCNEKGDTTCEICLQQFKPDYTSPPQLFHYGGIPMNFRGRWEVSSRDLHDSQIVTMVPSDRGFMDSDYNCHPSRSTLYYRSVAIIFMTLFILRHSLPLVVGEVEEDFTTPFSLLVSRVVGILIPIIVLARVLCIFQRRRQLQGARNVAITDEESLSSVSLPDEESLSSVSIYQSQPHVVRVC